VKNRRSQTKNSSCSQSSLAYCAIPGPSTKPRNCHIMHPWHIASSNIDFILPVSSPKDEHGAITNFISRENATFI